MKHASLVAISTIAVVVAASGFASAGSVLVNDVSEYSGTYGMKVTITDTSPAYVETDTPSGETTYTFRFYLNANCLTLAGNGFNVFEALDGSANAWIRVALSQADGFQLSFEARQDDTTYATVSEDLQPGWHLIEATWTAGSPGSFTARIDNQEVTGSPLAPSNSAGSIDTARMGAVSGIDGGTSGYLNFDDFASFRTDSVIGPVEVFNDIPSGAWFLPDVLAIYGAGVTTGCGGGNFCPYDEVTRSQMAAFILRGENYSACTYAPPEGPGSPSFDDVNSGQWFYDWVEEFYAQGFTSGCGPGMYCPFSPVTRGQMAVFLLRGKYGTGYTPPACTEGSPSGFDDVPITHPFCSWIKKLGEDGITTGCGSGNYCPFDSVTRAQMAAFLQRTYGLSRVLAN